MVHWVFYSNSVTICIQKAFYSSCADCWHNQIERNSFFLHSKKIFDDFYVLFVGEELDRENQSNFSLIFEAFDERFTTSKTLNISLIDLNDNAPFIVNFIDSIEIDRNFSPNREIFQFLSEDLDEPNSNNSKVSFSLLTSENSDFFQIDSQSGILRFANRTFDENSPQLFFLTINVSDHGVSPKSLQNFYNFSIRIVDRAKEIFDFQTKILPIYDEILTRDLILILLVSSFFTVIFLLVVALLCAFICRNKSQTLDLSMTNVSVSTLKFFDQRIFDWFSSFQLVLYEKNRTVFSTSCWTLEHSRRNREAKRQF